MRWIAWLTFALALLALPTVVDGVRQWAWLDERFALFRHAAVNPAGV